MNVEDWDFDSAIGRYLLRRFKWGLLTLVLGLIVIWGPDLDAKWRFIIAASLVAGCVLFLFIWDYFVAGNSGLRLLPPWRRSRQNTDGDARFLSLFELLTKFRWKADGIVLGRPLRQHRPFGCFKRSWIGRTDGHVLTVFGTRSGMRQPPSLIPTLLLYPGSALVIDPKGELAQITAARRGHGSNRVTRCLQQRVFILDPENQVPTAEKARWNPLREFDPHDPDLIAKVQKIAYAVVPPEPSGEEQCSLGQARDLLTMLILHVFDVEPIEHHNLIFVRRRLTDPFEALLEFMAQGSAQGGKVAEYAKAFLALPVDMRNRIIGDLYTRTCFLDQPGLQHMLEASDFTLQELKLHPTTIYVCFRGTSLATTMRPIANVLLDLAIDAMESVPHKPRHNVLFALDEFYLLGRQASIERAMRSSAGIGVRLWLILQTLDQLKQHYPTWDTFIRNCGAVQYAGDLSSETIQDLEKQIGDVVTVAKDGRRDRRPLLSVNELATSYFSRESRRVLVFFKQQPPAPLEWIEYYNEPSLASLAEPLSTAQNAAATAAWARQDPAVRAR